MAYAILANDADEGQAAMGLRDLFRRSGSTAQVAVQQRQPTFPQRPTLSVSSSCTQIPTLAPGGERSVVGEARHQDYLEELACGRDDRGCVVQHVMAELVREPDNPYDSDAVRVDVGGRQVGYIPRDEAADYHDVIAALWERGLLATCRAKLTGGWDRPGDRGHIGVCLDIDDDLRESAGAAALIPCGPRVTVTCEEHYCDLLGNMLGAKDRMVLPVVRLVEREANPHKPKQASPAIAVQIDGADIGYLTPAMAERYLPVVRHFAAQDVETTCTGSLKRTAKQIEVRLEMPLPEQLGIPPAP